MISIIVPAYNEAENIEKLLLRIDGSLKNKDYEVIVIDDHSKDATWEILKNLKTKYPVSFFKKIGQKGKAFSLFEGFEKAEGEILAMIDADLQYPPEAIAHIAEELEYTDVVVANRKVYQASIFRKIASRAFRYIFGRFLFGLDADIQSGLKAFRREVWETVKFYPKSQWSFDLEFLARAREANFKGRNFDIVFAPREKGTSNITLLANGWELATAAIALAIRQRQPIELPSIDS